MSPLQRKAIGHSMVKRLLVGQFLMKLARRGYLWVPFFAFAVLLLIPFSVLSDKTLPDSKLEVSSRFAESSVPGIEEGQEGLGPVHEAKTSHHDQGFLKVSLLQVFGGLGLFLFGLRLVSDCLQKVVGYRMKNVVATLTKRPLYGLLLGIIVTGIIQSSSATTVMVVGLVNAGLMSFVQSIGVILGANIGSTILPQIVALNLEEWAFPAIGVGMVLHLFFKNARVKNNGLVLLGFGMLFLGLGLMKDAIPPGTHRLIQDFFILSSGSFKGILTGLTVGIIATAVVQASGVTVGIIVVLASQGIVTDLTQAIPLILGCNIGTCVTALIASIGTNFESKRVAVSHTFFNIFGAFLTLVIFYRFYLWFIPEIGGSLAHQIANLHVTVKLVDALLFLPVVGLFSRFISRIVPAKVVRKPSIETTQYLDDRFVNEPVVAIELAIKEIVRLGQISRNMIKYAMDGFIYNDETLLDRVEAYRKAVRTLREAISRYVIQISQQDLTEKEAERVPKLILSVNNFDRVAGHAVRLLELGRTKVSKNIPLVGSALNELRSTYREVDAMLTEVSQYLPEFRR
jgi:phosphate:Na+ symporter